MKLMLMLVYGIFLKSHYLSQVSNPPLASIRDVIRSENGPVLLHLSFTFKHLLFIFFFQQMFIVFLVPPPDF